MPYEIKHTSRNECLIQYTLDDEADRKKGVGLPVLTFGVIAIVMGMDISAAIIIVVLVLFLIGRLHPPRTDFEIEINRRKKRITVRNTKQLKPKSMVYPLDNFFGFEISEAQSPQKSKHGSYGDLFFKFNNAVKANEKASRNTLLHRATKQVNDGRVFWKTPIRAQSYPVPLDNAVDIVEVVDAWLDTNHDVENQIEAASVDTPNPDPEPEVMRDFRDMN